MMWCDTAGVW